MKERLARREDELAYSTYSTRTPATPQFVLGPCQFHFSHKLILEVTFLEDGGIEGLLELVEILPEQLAPVACAAVQEPYIFSQGWGEGGT